MTNRLANIPTDNITEAIERLVELYAAEYDVDAYHTNCGQCEDFANDIVELFPEAVAEWGDGLCDADEVDQYMYHCILLYQGKFYDSEHPQGVEDFRSISAFHS